MREKSPTRRTILAATAATGAAGLLAASTVGFVGATNVTQTTVPAWLPFLHGPADSRAGGAAPLAALERADAWFNSPPLTAASLRGKVVLIDFWTYTCINWLRTLPYVRAWAEKYREQGLAVIGVHAPEFSFEKDLSNVRTAVADLRVHHPVAVDNDHAIWRAFRNQYWPALYFVDAQGHLRHHHFGEGAYEQSEMVLQKMLIEAGAASIDRDLAPDDGKGIEAAADWRSLMSGENYLGYQRTQGFASPGGPFFGGSRTYEKPDQLRLNQWALTGPWTMKSEAVALSGPSGSIVYRFHARDLHLVMGHKAKGTRVRFRVTIDGEAPGAAHGGDIDATGNGVATGQRLYQLVRQDGRIADRQFEITFLDPGGEAFAFTFG